MPKIRKAVDALLPSDLLKRTKDGHGPEGPVAVDTETSGLFVDDGARVATVSVAWREGDQVVALAWPFDQGLLDKPEAVAKDGSVRVGEDDHLNLGAYEWRSLLEWLTLVGQDAGLVMHNAKFDLHMLIAGCRRWPGVGLDRTTAGDLVMWDTQLTNALIWPLAIDPKTRRRTTSLKPTGARLWGNQVTDEQARVKEYLRINKLPSGRWDLMPWSVIGQYATDDAKMTLLLMEHQRDLINAGQAWLPADRAYQANTENLFAMRTLLNEELRGIPYDGVLSTVIANDLTKKQNEIAAKLPFRPTLPAAKEWFFGSDGAGLTPYGVTAKGDPQLTDQIAAQMVADGVPLADEWRSYQKISRAKSMWYTAYANALGSDGRLRTSFRQTGTVSGRLSCERVNLQAIPQDYRLSEFDVLDGVPTPRDVIGHAAANLIGWDQWELDLAQAELRVAASYADCTLMLEAIANGEDLHGITARELFDADESDPLWDLYRQVGKRANFSLIFGAGPIAFQRMLAAQLNLYWTDQQAQTVVYRWNGLYPQFRKAIDTHMERVARRQLGTRIGDPDRGGWIGVVGGGRRWFERYEDTHKAFNQRVQGSLAVLGQRWFVKADQYLMDQGVGVARDGTDGGLLLTIHDSLVLQLPAGHRGEHLAGRVKDIGLGIWSDLFPNVPGNIDLKRWKTPALVTEKKESTK